MPVLAGRQLAERQRAEAHTGEFLDGMPDRFAHPAHFTVVTLTNDELQPRLALTSALDAHLGGGGDSLVQAHAARQPRERVGSGCAFHLDPVRLANAIARMGQPQRQLAIVRQQQKPGRMEVEAPNREHAPAHVRQQLAHRRPPFRIRKGRHDPDGLVEENVNGFSWCW